MTIQHGFAQRRLSAQGPCSEPGQPCLTLAQLLLLRAQQSPASLAYAFLRDDLSPVDLSYQQLELRVRDLAAHIATRARPGDRALLVYGPGLDPVVAFWACLYAGVVPVPAPSPDALRLKTTLPRLLSLAADARSSIVLAGAQMRDAAHELSLNKEAGLADWIATDLEFESAKDFRPPPVAASEPAYLQYTSGSTSTPRGVMVTHANVVANCAAISAMIQPDADSRVLLWLPYFHDYGLVCGIICPVVFGMPGYLMSPVTFLRRPLRWLEAIERFGISHTGAPNFAYAACSKAVTALPEWHADLSSLRDASCGAEPINPTTVSQFNAAFARHGLSPTAFSPAYGLAEATLLAARKPYGTVPRVLTVNASALRDGRVEHVDTSDARTLVSCGIPAHGTQIAIVDTESGTPCPAGRVGEIWLASASVAAGYWDHKEATHATFERSLPSVPNRHFLRTGDLGFMHGGELYVTGRMKDLVIIHGRNYYPQDIEWTVEHAAPPLRLGHGAAFSIEGEDGERLVVVQEVDRSAQDGDLDQAVRAIRAAVAREHELPIHAVVLVRSGSLARTSSGKIRRSTCRQAFLESKLSVLRLDVHDPSVAEIAIAAPTPQEILAMRDPAGRQEAIEALVVELIARLTGRDSSDVPVTASAIECGLDSLTTFRLLNEIETALSVALPPSSVLGEASLRGFGTRIVEALERASVSDDRPGAIAPIDRSQAPALSFAQQRLWFLAQFEGVSEAYHIAGSMRLSGELDRAALGRALDRIVARHETLRTTFIQHDGQPLQRIAPADCGFLLHDHDLRRETDPAAAFERLAAQEATGRFDLERGPLIRGRLARQAEREHTLLITMHHIVSDGWSMGILIDELSTLYRAFRNGEADPLRPLPIQYADYAAWQRHWLSGERLQRQADYWKRTLSGAPALLELPTDRPRPAQQDPAGASLEVELDPTLVRGLKALSQRHGTTLYMTQLAGWSALLSRLSGQHDLVIGSPVANRTRTESERLIGFFVNTLAVRIDLSGAPTVTDLLARVKAQALAAQDHQDLPFEQVVELVQPPRGLSYTPLFQVTFAWQNAPAGNLDLPGLSLEPVESPHVTAPFDLMLSLQEADDGITGSLGYATALFDRNTMERHLGYWRTLLEGLAADDAAPVDRLPLLDAAERNRLLVEWNATGADYPQDHGIHQLFEDQAARTPDAVAVVHGDRQLSYAELNAAANRLAHHLRTLGVGPKGYVATMLERSIDLVVAELAALKCGAAYVPIDPTFPADRQAFMLADCGARVLLASLGMAVAVPSAVRRVNVDALLAEGSGENVQVQADGSAAAYVMYTSGSTGQPKGVVVPHRAIGRLVLNNGYAAFDAGDRVAFAANPGFDATTLEVWAPLLNGGSIVVIDQEVFLEPARLAAFLKEFEITALFITTALFNHYAATRPDAFAGLRFLLTGGERADPASFAQILRMGPPQHLIHCYGPTETTTFAITHDIRDAGEGARSIPLGRPIANTRIYVLDPHGEPVPVGVAGEIHIGGAGVARGYLNRPELTAERFLRDPFSAEPGARMYKSGDLGRWLADGTLEFLGRNDFQVKLRGFRIELGEIEAQLAGYPGVREAVVLARDDRPGERRLVAYIVAGDAAASSLPAIDPAALSAYLKSRLPEYMVPAAYVRLEALPLTPNGKLDRKALPAPEGDACGVRGYEAPVGEIETTLARIWAEVLKVERVGRQDHFFELGGHSLLAVTLIERVRQAGLRADVRALFNTPTLAGLAAAVGGENGQVAVPANGIPADCTAITPAMLPLVNLSQTQIDGLVAVVPGGAGNVQDLYPLAPLQEGILFHHLMATTGDPYLLAALLSFDTVARLEGFLGALQAVIDRHDILRTGVAWEGLPEPVQVVWRRAPLPIEAVHLDAAGGGAAAQLRDRFDPRRCRIDVRQAPLIRAYTAHDTANDRWLLRLLMHHLAIDHTALDILLEEIQAHLLGQEARLPSPLPFRNFVAQARLGISREEHESFFRDLLGDVDEPTAPFGLLDVQGDGSAIVEAARPVDADLARRLRGQARALGVSAASLCHLAFGQVLARVSGRTDVVFGTVLFGRIQGGEGAARVMGMFINTLPVRLRIGEEGVADSVRRTHTLLADVLRHEHAPSTLAQRCSAVPAPAPLFTALLNYRHSAGRGEASAETLRGWDGITEVDAHERTNYPVVLSVDDLGVGFRLSAQVQQPIAPERLCDFMDTALANLVEALERATATAVRAIDVLPEAERRQILIDWNATAADYPRDRCIHQLFEDQAARTPDAVAVVHGEQQLRYAELNAAANRLAHHLRDLHVKPDDRVAICVERSLEMVVGLLAILKAGGAYVPLDPAYPAERLAFMLADSAPVALLTQGELAAGFLEAASAVPVIDLVADAAQWAGQSQQNPDPAAIGLTPQHLAYVIYTSGSTGRPKGALIEHGHVARLFAATDDLFGFNANDVWSLFHSYAFDFSVWEIWGALFHGGRLVIVPLDTARSPGDFYRLVCREGVTVLNQTPSAFRQLIAAQTESRESHQLRYVILGGEALEVATLKPWYRQNDGRNTQLVNMYGITETTVHVTYRVLKPADTERSGGSPIGCRIPDLRVYILNEQAQLVPVGVAGEIHIGGAGVARGYLNRPELTAERFLPDPFSAEPGARMYKTGDLGRWLVDGTLEFLGRNDFQVKLRGFRIELGEIEVQLAGYPGVREAVVLAREDRPGERRLVAYIVAGGQGSVVGGGDGAASSLPAIDPAALTAYLKSRLPEYMVPAAYVRLEALPLTPNGKLDRKALPAPEGDAYGVGGYEAPVGEIETTLARIWAEILKVERVGRHDHFFDLGGHSLLATQITVRARDALQVDLPLRTIFEAPTIAGMATCIAQLRSRTTRHEADSPIEVLPRGDPLPVSFSQRRMWLVQQLEPQGTAYNMPFAVRLRGRLDHQALTASVNQLVHRHEAFRTTFSVANGEPVQVIAPPAPVHIQSIDLRSIPEPDRSAEGARLFRAESMRPFDLAQGPLFRFLLVRLGDNDHAMLWLVHHTAGDQWSAGILSRELAVVYRALSRGEQFRLEPLKVQYADFAAWQRRDVENATLHGQLDYWREKLHGAPVLTLPTDRPRPAQRTSAGSYLMTTLPRATLAELKRMSARQGATPFMTLLACFKLLLARYSGQDDIVVGSPIANRTRVEIEPLVGTFVNTLVLRTDLSGDPTFAQLLARVRSTAVDAYAHQDLAFEELVEELGGSRADGHSPLVQVLFNVPNAPVHELVLDGLEVEVFDFDTGSAQFDLSLSVETEVDGRVFLSYSTELFDASTANRMLAQYLHLISQAIANPEQTLSVFDIITPDEAALMLGVWNRTDTPYPRDQRVDQLVTERAQRSPHALAVAAADGLLTYAELDRKANRLAHHLRGLGVGAESPVGICLERTADLIVVLLAVMKAGGAYVPLDPAFPAHRLQAMAEDAGLVLLVTQTDLLRALPPMPGKTLCLQEARTEIAQQPTDGIERPSAPSDLAYVLYTSGSTGRPKGVEVEHGALTNFLCSMHSVPGIGANDTLLAVTTLSFDIAGLELYLPLIAGARVELASREEASDPRLLLQRLERCRPTLMQATPTMWRLLIEAGWEGSPDLTVLCGGEGLPAALAARLLPRCAALWNLYGPTETTIWSTLEHITPDAAPISIGRPIHNTRVYVLDRGRKPVPLGVAGELYIGGAGVARGYRSRPDRSAERFFEDPFSSLPGARLYRTGDLARFLPDGRLLHLGRLDHQVKVRGSRVELGEIEAALATHPGIAQVVVAPKAEADGGQQLVAYLIAREAHERPDAMTLRAHLRSRLPDYMVPLHFVFMDAFPQTANRKVDIPALPAPPPIAEHDTAAAPPTEPRGRLEVQLTVLWRQVLGDEALGVHDNFFDRGGHSLKAVQLISFLEQVTGRQLPLVTLFQAPTVAEMAQLLTKANWRPSWRSLVAVQPLGRAPPIFAIPGVGGNVLGFAGLSTLLGNDQPFYALQARGLDNAEKPFKSIPKMGAHYVSEIRSVRPHGPYIVAGACTGGVTAYEMARQLVEQGETVRLILLDTWHPKSALRPHRSDTTLWPLQFLWLKACTYWRALAELPLREWPEFFARKAQIARAITARSIQDTLAISGYHSGRVVEATWIAVAAYKPGPLRCKLLNVIADDNPVAPESDTRRMWEPLALNGSEVLFIHAANSGRLFMTPHVTELATQLAQRLADATGGAQPQ